MSEERIDIDPQRLYTVQEARVLLSPSEPLHPDSVYRMGAAGRLATVKVGRRGGRTLFPGWGILRLIHGEAQG